MLQALGRIVDQHRETGRGPPRARNMLTGHVARDARILIRQVGELLQDRQQLLRVGPRLEEIHRLLPGIGEVRVRHLPDFPRVHAGQVRVVWQA